MSDKDLRLQVILNAVDRLSRPFRNAQASSKELAAAIRHSRDALKQLGQAGNSLENYRKLQAENKKLGDRLSYARQRASLLSNELGAMGPPSQRQIVILQRQQLAVQRLEERQKKLQHQTALVRGELYRAGISAKDGAGATARITRETERFNSQLAQQEAKLKRVGEQQRKINTARANYSRTLETRDRIAGAGASAMAAGVAIGAPVMAAVKSYASMEDAMKGVAKQVSGLRDDNGNRTARFYEMQDAIKAASEQLPMQNGAIDYAALVEGGARMNVANPNDSWADQKRDLLAFASTAAKASTAFELPADELSESLGKIAQLYKVPTRNIEQLGDALNYLDDNAMSKGGDIINVLQRMGGIADKLDYRKAAALGSTFLSLGTAPEVAGSAANAMVSTLSSATVQTKSFYLGIEMLKLNPAELEKQMTHDAMGTIQRVLEKVNSLPADKRLGAMMLIFGKEFGDDAAKLANNLPELQRQLNLTAGNDASGSMQKESDINKDSLSAQWLLVKTGAQNTFSSLGETLRQPLMEIMDTMKRITGAVRRWIEANPVLAGRIMKIVAVVAAVTAALGTFAVAAAAVLGPLALLRFGMSKLGIKGLGLLPRLGRLGGVFSALVPGIAGAGDKFKKLIELFTGGKADDAVGWIERIRQALSGGDDDSNEEGVLDAFRGGVMDKIKEQAGAAGEALVIAFRNPRAAVTQLGSSIRTFAISALAPLMASIRGAGGLVAWLATGPLVLLRMALFGIAGLMGFILSPIGLVIAALTVAALVIWKYWQPITAFLGGVVEGFKAAAGPIGAAFEPLKPIFQWVGDKVKALWGWFTSLLTPVKATSEELNNAAEKGRQFGKALADSLNMVLHPLETLKSGVSSLLEKLGMVSKEAANVKLPEQVTRQQPAAVSSDGKVVLPPGGFPMMGFAGMYDSGGFIPRGQFGIVGENGPEIVNGPAYVTSRRRTAALASVVAGVMGVAATQAAAVPLHPFSLPVNTQPQSAGGNIAAPVMHVETHAPITIYAQPGQNAQDIAREVARQLDERERRARAKARSNFSDQGGYES